MAATQNSPDGRLDDVSTQGNALPRPDTATAGAPRIVDFYADPKLKPSEFLKAVRAAKLKTFKPDDRDQALRSIGTSDPMLSRTTSLLGKDRDAVRRWVTEVTIEALKEHVPDILTDGPSSSGILFDQIMRSVAADLGSKDKPRSTRAANLSRLALVWLLEQRNLKPIDAFLSIEKVTRKRGGAGRPGANDEIVKILTNGYIKQLINPSVVARYFEDSLNEARAERLNVHEVNVKLREKLSDLESALRHSNEQRGLTERQLRELRDQLRDEKELRQLDTSRQVGRSQSFLRERLRPLLSDARDALDFDPPHTEATRQRVEMALAAVDGELEKADE